MNLYKGNSQLFGNKDGSNIDKLTQYSINFALSVNILEKLVLLNRKNIEVKPDTSYYTTIKFVAEGPPSPCHGRVPSRVTSEKSYSMEREQ